MSAEITTNIEVTKYLKEKFLSECLELILKSKGNLVNIEIF